MSLLKSPPIHQTPLYRARAAYRNMHRRCENRCGTEPAYAHVKLKMTLAEWLAWSVPKYETFIAKNPGVRPSVSRFGDKGHYEIGNIDIIPWIKNRQQMAMPGQAKDGKKRCSKCRETKPIVEFGKNRTHKDGYAHHCRSCQRVYATQLRAQKQGLDTPLDFS